MLFKNKYIEKRNSKALDYIKANCYKITDIENGELLYNYKCHINSVQNYYKKKQRIFGVYIIDKGNDTIISHFINYDGKKYIETTLGRICNKYDYYISKEFKIEEFNNPDAPLDNLKNNIFNLSYTNKLLNKLYKLTPYTQF